MPPVTTPTDAWLKLVHAELVKLNRALARKPAVRKPAAKKARR
jgi:hypothetical protein